MIISQGVYDVEFINGEKRTIHVERCMTDAHALPIVLIDFNEVIYNWNVILSVKKTG